ncbi:tail protein X [Francisella sp. SYW-9]|uniref:tail protein X n=1 Tax=Francisella sp. SYW-9 TaxID=2610888 RepID=UPI00123E37A0|nr:tail protein X [Francisella sp. SYW-9]
MIIYKTKDGEMLDNICFKYYGTSEAIIQVLAANRHLAQYTILPINIDIVLPEIEEPSPQRKITLW